MTLTAEALRRRGIQGPSVHVCWKQEGNIEQLLLQCESTKQVWNIAWQALGLKVDLHSKIKEYEDFLIKWTNTYPFCKSGTSAIMLIWKLGYDMANTNPIDQRHQLWKKVWPIGLIPKIALFMWAAVLKGILTLDNLKKRGYNLPNRCCLCEEEEKSVSHLLIHCKYSSQIWYLIADRLGFQWEIPKSLEGLLLQWVVGTGTKKTSRVLSLLAPHIC